MERTGTPADTCSCCGHSAAFHDATGCAEWRDGKRCLCPAGGYIPVSELGEKGCAVMDLDELERLEAEATPGPWSGRYPLDEPAVVFCDHPTRMGNFIYVGTLLDKDDAVFLCAIRNAAPDLFREVRTLRADLDAALERAEKAERERDEAREKAANTNAAANAVFRGADDLRADRDEWKQQHENAVACWYEERDRLMAQRNEARAEVERLREENTRIRSDHATQCEPLYEAADRVAEAYRTGAFLDTRTLEPLAQAVERIDRKMAAMMDRIAVPVLPIDPEADALVDRLVSEKVREQDARVPLGDVDRLRRHVKRLADFAREARDAARNIDTEADRVLYSLGDDDV